MRKFLLLAGIFTFFAYSQAKAEQYYGNGGYYPQDEPRYVERVEYREPVHQDYRKTGYEYKGVDSSPRYKRIRNRGGASYQRENYRQSNYYNQYEEPNKIRPYIGLDVATTKMDFGTDDWVVDNYNGGYEYHDNKNETLSFVVGAKFNKYIGVEAFYQKSEENEKKTIWDFGNAEVIEEDKLSYTSMGVDVIGYMPVNQELELLASLGLGQYDFESSFEDAIIGYGSVGGEKKDFDSLGIRLGIGTQYNFNEHFALRAMARYIKMNDDEYVKSLTEFSLGLRYMF